MIRPNGACSLGHGDAVHHGLRPYVARLAAGVVGGDGGTYSDDPVELWKQLSSTSAAWLARRRRTLRMMVTFSLFTSSTHHRKRRKSEKPKAVEDDLGNFGTQFLRIRCLECRVKGPSG